MLSRNLLVPLGAPPWRQGFNKLKNVTRSQIGVNTPHQNSVMASPPTITTGSSQPSGLTTSYRYTDAAPPFKYYGGVPVVASGAYLRYASATIFSSGGNVGSNNGQNASTWRVHVIINSAKFAFRVGGTGQKYRFIVDGQYVDLTGTDPGNTGALFYVTLDFTSVGGAATRSVILEGQNNNAFMGVYVSPGDTVTQPTNSYLSSPTVLRAIFDGDSFTAGTGATFIGDAYPIICGELLGVCDNWCCGVGGSGYISTNGGTVYNIPQHLTDVTGNAPDVIVLASSLNDLGGSTASAIAAVAQSTIGTFRQAFPKVPIFVVGPWDVNAPGAPATNFAATTAALRGVCLPSAGVFFIDMTGVSYTKSDATHPDTAGHSTLGTYIANAIKTILGVS